MIVRLIKNGCTLDFIDNLLLVYIASVWVQRALYVWLCDVIMSAQPHLACTD